MDLDSLLAGDSRILSDGSMYELLRRSPEVEFDPHIAHAGLIYDDTSKAVLERATRAYIEVGVSRQLPMALTTTTWRANRERVAASAFAGRPVNEDNARYLLALRDEYAQPTQPIAVGGVIGPKGDAYKPEEAPNTNDARDFHTWQIEALAGSGVDFLQAATLPAMPEARGIAQAMANTGLPYLISFVIEKSGNLLDGHSLAETIDEIDAILPGTSRYAVNCVHPTVMQQALDNNPRVANLIVAFAGNTSARSVDELDGLEELDTEDPASSPMRTSVCWMITTFASSAAAAAPAPRTWRPLRLACSPAKLRERSTITPAANLQRCRILIYTTGISVPR